MKVIVCKDEDARALLDRLELKHHEIKARFAQQSDREAYVVGEVMRGVRYEIVTWLQAQGFTLP